jgi:hypothetical protein
MTAASIYVVAQRTQLFVFESNTSRKQKEYGRMIAEKFQGGGECIVATWQALAENYPLMAGSIASNPMSLADDTASLADRGKERSPINRRLKAACAFSASYISAPMHIGIFISTVGLQSMAPLHKRVVDNMERLSH